MAKLTVEETSAESTYAVLPADTIVQLEVVDIDQRTATSKKGDSWEKLEFKFRVTGVPTALEGEYGSVVGSHIWGSVPLRLTEHPDNKLRQWAEALLGLELSAGFELDTDDLVGRRARGLISNYKKKDGSDAHQVAGLLSSAMATVGSPSAVSPTPVPQGSTGGGFFADLQDEPPF